MDKDQSLQHNILHACSYQREQSAEQFLSEHAFGITLSGEAQYYMNEGTFLLKEGSIGFIRKNQLLKKYKKPSVTGEPFKLVGIILDQNTLHQYAAENNIAHQSVYKGSPVIDLSGDAILKGFFDSLMPYIDNPQKLTQKISALKTQEAIELLLQKDDSFENILFDFQKPHKINLEAFMNMNYKYNVSLATFAKLTGRSLSSFKRDFANTFSLSPEKWLQQKRLEQAYYLISKIKQRPSEVYLEVGFENFSHFSSAFKKSFGLPPSELMNQKENAYQ